MTPVLVIAGREFREGLRNRWVLAATLVLAVLALTLAFVGSTPTGTVKASPLEITVVSLSSLSIFLLPLMALMLAYDGIAGEAEKGTLLLLLSYPVARWQIILGKFAGHTLILAVATIVGFGAAGIAVAMGQEVWSDGWTPFLVMMGSSILLGAAFAAIGTLISAWARERAVAAALGIAVWLVFVIIFDMALLGLLAADTQQRVGPETVPYLLMLNPADVYRFLNLTSFENVSALAGVSGLGATVRLDPAILIAVFVAWILLPLGAATMVFRGRRV